jgi:nicotinate-nucleotide adenylyltransferase
LRRTDLGVDSAREEKVKIGVLGGTFDPVHLGHIVMAEEARKELGLAEVIVVPAGQPMAKSTGHVTLAEKRIEMLRLAIIGKPHLKISYMDIERPGPSYTVDTIDAIKKRYGGKAEIYFILGWDSLAQLPDWREPGRIVEMCYLVAVPRPGWSKPDLEAMEKNIPGISQKVTFIDKPNLDISATMIREKVARREAIDQLVPGLVAEYIKKHRLYIQK